jgi:hypothetical protein
MTTPSLDELHRQHGVATRRQLTAAGKTQSEIDAAVAAQRWQRINSLVIVCHNGPLTRAQGFWVAVLSARRPVAVCGLSLLELLDIRGFTSPAVHLLVPRGAGVAPTPGIELTVHESRRFCAQDVRVLRHLPTTTVTRGFIDAAAWSPDPRTAHRIIVAAVQQRRTPPRLLLDQLQRAGAVQHRRTLMLLLQDLEGGAQALSEVEFLRFCRRHGFPRPELQHRDDSFGRRRYLDAVFKGTNGRYFTVEIDGGVHLNVSTRWKDTSKDNWSGLARKLVLRFASFAIYTDDAEAVAQIRLALELVSA